MLFHIVVSDLCGSSVPSWHNAVGYRHFGLLLDSARSSWPCLAVFCWDFSRLSVGSLSLYAISRTHLPYVFVFILFFGHFPVFWIWIPMFCIMFHLTPSFDGAVNLSLFEEVWTMIKAERFVKNNNVDFSLLDLSHLRYFALSSSHIMHLAGGWVIHVSVNANGSVGNLQCHVHMRTHLSWVGRRFSVLPAQVSAGSLCKCAFVFGIAATDVRS